MNAEQREIILVQIRLQEYHIKLWKAAVEGKPKLKTRIFTEELAKAEKYLAALKEGIDDA